MDLIYNPVKPKKNNHPLKKKRALSRQDHTIIRRHFLKSNGQILEDYCKTIHSKLSPDISIFQVVGYVMALHAQIKKGDLSVSDRTSYDKFIESHRRKWGTYKSLKYMNMNSNHKKIRSVKWTPLLKAAHKGRGNRWLVPKENAAAVYNFWKFFVSNYKDIKSIIRNTANKYAALISPDDMHEELIISLQRNDILSQFNPTKAKLNTFLTMKVQGYAKHLLTKRLKEPGTVDIETLNPSKNDFQEYGTEEDTPLTQLKPLLTPSIEEDLIVKEVLSSIKKRLDPVQQEVLVRKCMGYSNKEIAQNLNCTISKVSKCMDLVRNISKELL